MGAGIRDHIGKGWVWRILAVGLVYALTVYGTGFGLGLRTAGFLTTIWTSTLGGIFLVLAFFPLLQRSRLTRGGLFFALWFVAFVVTYLVSVIEMPYFTTYSPNYVISLALQGLLVSLVFAGLVVWLLKSTDGPVSWPSAFHNWFSDRRWYNWLGRIVLCGLAYLLLYLVVGGISYAVFTQQYYTDPKLASTLHLKPPPSFGVILPLELARGCLFSLALIPIIVGVVMKRSRLALWLGLILVVVGDLVPMLQGQDLPLVLRVYTGVEILFQNGPLGIFVGYVMSAKEGKGA